MTLSCYLVGFNPRPPITAGESGRPESGYHGLYIVSIRARQLRRANRTTFDKVLFYMNVSIRARQLRRANRPACFARTASAIVSIRARQLRRANQILGG